MAFCGGSTSCLNKKKHLVERAGWFDLVEPSTGQDHRYYTVPRFSRDGDIDGTLYITDSDDNPNVFKLNRNDDDLWLNNNWTKPANKWNPKDEFVFRLRNCGFSVR